MSRCLAMALLVFSVATTASATGRLYTSVNLAFEIGPGQAWVSSVAHADYLFAAWWEPTPYVGGTHTIENSTASETGGSSDGSWTSPLTGYALFGECGYRGTIEAFESDNWTTQGASTASQCCPMPRCTIHASHTEGGYTSPATWTLDCGDTLEIAAYAFPSYEFNHWEGEAYSTSNPISIRVTQNPTSITAYFTPTCDPADPGCLCDPITNPACPCDRLTDPNCCDPLDPSCNNENWVPPNPGNPPNSPIVLNLARGQYRLTGRNDPVMFDIGGTGTPSRIGWTAAGADEAFLCLDRNDNGRIDDGSELFGTATRLKSGVRAANGFAALAEYDDDCDGFINSRDAIWARLLLWRDLNHDGVSQPAELTRAAAAELKAVRLDYHWTGRRDWSGNIFGYESLVWVGNGGPSPAALPVYDVFFVSAP